jgi:hypothetical protein
MRFLADAYAFPTSALCAEGSALCAEVGNAYTCHLGRSASEVGRERIAPVYMLFEGVFR